MKRPWLAAVVLGLALLVGPAQAQDSSGLLFAFGPATNVISRTSINAAIQGDLTVTFRGDPAAGCAGVGLCSYSGTIVVRPRTGDVTVLTVRSHGRIGHVVVLELGSPESSYTTSARVARSAPGGLGGTCADAQSSSSFFAGETSSFSRGRLVTVRVLTRDGSLLRTRCAGPLDGDLTGMSPAVTLPVARLLRGRMTLDLGGTRSFASHGLSGTISSTLMIKLGPPSIQPANGGFPPGVRIQRVRTVTEHLTLVRVGGGLTATVQGTSNPIVCGLLDSCGASGTLSLVGGVQEASASVIATGPASRPYTDFLTALGLSRSGGSRGIAVFGTVSWVGRVRASMSQAGSVCSDTAATGGVGVPLALGGTFGGFTGSWRTRCPGPSLASAQPVLAGALNRTAVSHRQFTIDVRANATSSSDDGYVIVAHGRLSLVLRRGRITQQVMLQPTG